MEYPDLWQIGSGMTFTWDEMIAAFRELGGVADNVVMRIGPRGRGLFPIDNTKPVRLHVPENLLVPARDIEFVNQRLTVAGSSTVGKAERAFFEQYQNTFSWGGGGRADCEEFVQGYDALPLEIAMLLFGDDKTQEKSESFDTRVQQMFLQSRRIARNGVVGDKPENESVLMSLLDLANHSPGAPSFGFANGISIQGIFPNEILVRYVLEDAFGIFRAYGFASPERIAFSLASRREEAPKLLIERKTNLKALRGGFRVPRFTIQGDNLELSCLMIGNMDAPRLSKGIFCNLAQEAGWTNAEEEFDRIVHGNRMSFLGLLKQLEAHHGGLVPNIRKMALYQLEAMSYCIGTRQLQ